MVMAPAKTGRDRTRRKAVISTAQTKRGTRSMVIPGALMLKMVVMKFMDPMIEEAPAA
jgi:hypothetical protein